MDTGAATWPDHNLREINHANYSPSFAASTSCQTVATSTPVVETEARKIIVLHFPSTAPPDAINDFLHKVITCVSSRLSRSPTRCGSRLVPYIHVPTHSDGTARGHAFVVFETKRDAKTAIEAFDGFRFQDRVLRAKFTKEGFVSEITDSQYPLPSSELHPSSLGWQPIPTLSSVSEVPSRSRAQSRDDAPHERSDGSRHRQSISIPVVDGSSSRSRHKGKSRKHCE